MLFYFDNKLNRKENRKEYLFKKKKDRILKERGSFKRSRNIV